MRIALIAAPFIAVPSADYGGTELFVAHLAEGLQKLNIDVQKGAPSKGTTNGIALANHTLLAKQDRGWQRTFVTS